MSYYQWYENKCRVINAIVNPIRKENKYNFNTLFMFVSIFAIENPKISPKLPANVRFTKDTCIFHPYIKWFWIFEDEGGYRTYQTK